MVKEIVTHSQIGMVGQRLSVEMFKLIVINLVSISSKSNYVWEGTLVDFITVTLAVGVAIKVCEVLVPRYCLVSLSVTNN